MAAPKLEKVNIILSGEVFFLDFVPQSKDSGEEAHCMEFLLCKWNTKGMRTSRHCVRDMLAVKV